MSIHPFKKFITALLMSSVGVSFLYGAAGTRYATIMFDGLAIVVPIHTKTLSIDTPIDPYTDTPTVTGTCKPGTTITLYVDGNAVSPTATCAGDGTFSITIDSELTDELHEITATQTDAGGHTDSLENPVTVDTHSYIPNEANLTDRMAVKFLDMATMGATPKMVEELKRKGVLAWVDEQLAKPWKFKKESIVYNMMYYALKMRPHDYCQKYNLPIPQTDAEINALINRFLADNDTVFNRTLIHGGNELDYHSSAILRGHVEDDAQLRQRVAFALSEIIVASESTDFFFRNKGEALSYYYDLLLKGAFGNYGDLLYDVSLSPAMATFLTYANNRKEHIDPDTNQTVYPDENYGREIMQLYTIGLFELNMDGTTKRRNGKRISSYSQQDVMEISRVFTGLTYAHHTQPNNHSPSLWQSDSLHPMVCYSDYHDDGEKTFLGQTVQAGQDCFRDIRDTVDILMNHPNTAPFIAKKLIVRLTKSNPKTDYVQRVAEVFKGSGGDLGKTVRAILLDKNIWEDIKTDRAVMIKEPYLMYIQMLRAMNVKPWPKRETTDDDGTKHSIENRYYVRSKYAMINQWPTYQPTVFGFFSDSYQPNNVEFKLRGWKAPKASLYTTKYMVGIENHTLETLQRNEYHYLYASNTDADGNYTLGHRSGQFYTYMLLNFANYLNRFKKPGHDFVDGPKDEAGREAAVRYVIEDASRRLLGKQLDSETVQHLVDAYKDIFTRYSDSWDNEEIQKRLIVRVIAPLITEIVMSEEYMTN